ncbi:MAG: beta-ketoacyl-[acyl-carrier-protein] synthase family protein [Actinocatenispora sp.]
MSAGRTGAVITGIGLVTPIGQDLATVFDALCVGRSGLRRPPEDHPAAQSLEVAGIVDGLDPSLVLHGPEVTVVDRFVVMAMLAADSALADAGITVGADVDPYRTAVVVSGTGGLATLESQVKRRVERGRAGVSPYLLPGMLPNMASARIAIRHNIRGYSSSIGTACAAGAQSVAEAVRLIRSGEADVVVCGCAEAPVFPTLADTFGNARALARGWDEPAEASRPFDRRRNGLVLSEGAGVLVIERAEHADARGAAGYVDVLGWGATTDAHHTTIPRADGEGAAEAMRRALRDADLTRDMIGYLNAHGTSTKLGDAAETRAIRDVFGEAGPPVSSFKAVTGHMLGASGVIELAASAVAMGAGALPPTHNLDDPDPACAVDHIRKEPRRADVEYTLSNSFGFGGHNISLVLGAAGTRQRRTLPSPPLAGSEGEI